MAKFFRDSPNTKLKELWSQRFEDCNKIPLEIFRGVTCSIDGFPLRCYAPAGMTRLLYAGKYQSFCCKADVVVDNKGRIISFSGPHIGTMHDKYIYDHYHPMFDAGELCLGDLGYWGADEHIIFSP
eukprot:TRINITY_DN337_c0_g1_i6.p1 TRINITY_DN337_c0_g1~~TRINITY_DN337_c0_g1_i6.p1  ORF type:complete len:126 (+),score=3.97 TRINITY_DN337_c0_g1_i6:369-746(+)